MTPFKEAVVFARNLGVATGIAFDQQGLMHVGDRTGTIFKVNGIGEERAWTQIEPSVSAFHLAFGPDDSLYVAGPTVTSFDSIWRINPDGETDVFFKGLGRPQGLAFDREGNLYVAAALRGRRGIVRISPDGSEAKVIVAGVNLVGLGVQRVWRNGSGVDRFCLQCADADQGHVVAGIDASFRVQALLAVGIQHTKG